MKLLALVSFIVSIAQSKWEKVIELKAGVNTAISDIGKAAFNNKFKLSGLIKRECPTCVASHQTIYYKRLTNVATFDAYHVIADTWVNTNNVLNTDFILTNDIKKAFAGTQDWQYCNYNDPKIPGFRDCGPSGHVGGWNFWCLSTRSGACRSINWYIWVVDKLPATGHWSLAINMKKGVNTALLDIGATSFNQKFAKTGLIKRVCPTCVASHKVIYYRRIGNTAFNAHFVMRDTWKDVENKLNNDFILTNDFNKALTGTRDWQYCNYNDPKIPAFRDCGPTGHVGGWNFWCLSTRSGACRSINWYIWVVDKLPANGHWSLAINMKKGVNTALLDIGATSFNQKFAKTGLIKRVCPTCVASHKVIYYRRIGNTAFNAHFVMRDTWKDVENKLNNDFILTNDFNKALTGTRDWQYCNYNDPKIPAFRDCGPTGHVGGWNFWCLSTRSGACRSVKFFIYELTGHHAGVSNTYVPLLILSEEINPSHIQGNVLNSDNAVADVNKKIGLNLKNNMRITFKLNIHELTPHWRNVFIISTSAGDVPRLPGVYTSSGSGLHVCVFGNANICYNSKVNGPNLAIGTWYNIEIYYTLQEYIVAVDGNVYYYTDTVDLTGVNRQLQYYLKIDSEHYLGTDALIKDIRVDGCDNCDLVRSGLINKLVSETTIKNQKIAALKTCSTNLATKTTELTKRTAELKEAEKVIGTAKTPLTKYTNKLSAKKNSDNMLLNNEDNMLIYIFVAGSVILNVILITIMLSRSMKYTSQKLK